MGERLVLNFHGVGPIPDWVEASERPYWCTEDEFTSILDRIPEVARESGVPIEITFDDGNASDVHLALPALASSGLSATFFVCAGRVGTEGYLDGPAMLELLSAGMSIGSHGWDHVDWRRVGRAALTREIDGSCRMLADVIGEPVDEVAIPFGSYDRRVITHLRRSGLRTVYTSDGGRTAVGGWLVSRQTYTAPWTIGRLPSLATARLTPTASAKRWVIRRLKQLR